MPDPHSRYAVDLAERSADEPVSDEELADALEEAGGDTEMVSHLRGPERHYRGCHVVDRLLGKA